MRSLGRRWVRESEMSSGRGGQPVCHPPCAGAGRVAGRGEGVSMLSSHPETSHLTSTHTYNHVLCRPRCGRWRGRCACGGSWGDPMRPKP